MTQSERGDGRIFRGALEAGTRPSTDLGKTWTGCDGLRILKTDRLTGREKD